MQPGAKKTYHILIVEDNEGDFLLVNDFLEKMFSELQVSKAVNFKQAVEILTGRHESIDAILLDLSLPDKKGYDLLNEIGSLSQNIPLIILTGYVNEQFAIEALAMGASDYLLKDNLNSTMLYKSILYNIERNKILVSLKESEKRYAELFHVSPQPMWVYDRQTLRFLDVNHAAVEQYGYSRNEFLAMTINDIENVAETIQISEKETRLFSSQTLYYPLLKKHTKKNRELITVNIQSNPIAYKDSVACLVLANDVSKNLEHIQAIEEQNSKLKEIAWIQSHVVRAPLARMMGLINLMTENLVTEEEKAECLKHLYTSSYELDGIIKQIVEKASSLEVFTHPAPNDRQKNELPGSLATTGTKYD